MATIIGNGLSNVLTGTGNADQLLGQGGDDKLNGLDGADMLDGGPGSDRIDGGKGFDTLMLDQGSYVDLKQGMAFNDAFNPLGATDADRLSNIDAVHGSVETDVLLGSRNVDYLAGAEGDDQIEGHRGNDVIDGGDGMDVLSGGRGDDQITGGDGADTILGDDDNDHLAGGADADFIIGGSGDDVAYGGSGDDFILGEAGNDELHGGPDRDTIFGGDGDDRLEGGEGTDFLRPGTGNDTVTLGSDAVDHVLFSLNEQALNFDNIGQERVQGFAAGPAHTLDISLEGFMQQDLYHRLAVVDTRGFLDSNHDGEIDGHDRFAHKMGQDLVLDLGGLMHQALGGQHGVHTITLEGAAHGFDADRIDPAVASGTTLTLPLASTHGLVEPPVTDHDLIA